MRQPVEPESGEVTAYLKRLVVTIVVGVSLMTATAFWAWHRYGKPLETRPPLPENHPLPPPISR